MELFSQGALQNQLTHENTAVFVPVRTGIDRLEAVVVLFACNVKIRKAYNGILARSAVDKVKLGVIFARGVLTCYRVLAVVFRQKAEKFLCRPA